MASVQLSRLHAALTALKVSIEAIDVDHTAPADVAHTLYELANDAQSLLNLMQAIVQPPASILVDQLVALLLDDDHARGCMGRQYLCTCGYDTRVDHAADVVRRVGGGL